MQEEVNEKTISICVKGGKISEELLRKAIVKVVQHMTASKQKSTVKKESQVKQGKTSLKQMMKDGSQLQNIEITNSNIKSFERVARKYGVTYSLKKDRSTEPPRYLVFFRAKDVDVITAAFKEYAGVAMAKEKKVSIRKKLQAAIEKVNQHRERNKEQEKDRGQSR